MDRNPGNEGVSVIVPTYCERETIGAVIEGAARALGRRGCRFEILVADDASPDGTAEAAERCGRSLGLDVCVVRRRGPRGLGAAVREAASAARYDVAAVLDADLSHDPSLLGDLVEPVLAGRADVVVGSRYVEGGRISGWSLPRRVLSRVGTALARRLVSVRDPLSGYFALRRTLLVGPQAPEERGFKVLLAVLAAHPGLRVREVPIEFRERRAGFSKFGLREGVRFLGELLRLFGWRAARRLRPAGLGFEGGEP